MNYLCKTNEVHAVVAATTHTNTADNDLSKHNTLILNHLSNIIICNNILSSTINTNYQVFDNLIFYQLESK